MNLAIAERARFVRALRSRPFALLWTGQTISSLGDGAFLTALAWEVLQLTHSATAMGIVAIAEMLPRVAFLLLGGVASDRLPRRIIMLWSDAGRALAVLAVAVLGWLGVLQLWHLIALAFVFGFADGFFMPAYQAIPPQLVVSEDLPSANALTGLSRQISQLVGPVLGAAFFTFANAPGAFAFDGLTFVVSACCLAAIHGSQTLEVARPALLDDGTPAAGRGVGGMVAYLREGLTYVVASPWLWVTIALASVANMGWTGAFVVALPKLIAYVYHAGVWLLGLLTTASAVGSIVATLVVGSIHRLRHRGPVAYTILLISSVALLFYGLPFPAAALPVIATGAGVVAGAGLGAFGIIWVTTLQELVPEDKLGRVSSIDWMGSLVLTPIGFALAGALADSLGPAWVFLGAGVLNIALTLVGFGVKGIRELD